MILTRSIKGWADVFAQVLAEEGISAHVGSREGYFETYEVSVLLDYLQILDNERQDLPLAAVLTSPFAGLDARELAKIRSTYPELFSMKRFTPMRLMMKRRRNQSCSKN